jgi:hypothetical protein
MRIARWQKDFQNAITRLRKLYLDVKGRLQIKNSEEDRMHQNLLWLWMRKMKPSNNKATKRRSPKDPQGHGPAIAKGDGARKPTSVSFVRNFTFNGTEVKMESLLGNYKLGARGEREIASSGLRDQSKPRFSLRL